MGICADGNLNGREITAMEIKHEKALVLTADGSSTLYDAETGEHYHSRHGAVGESRHVFLGMGLQHYVSTRTSAVSTQTPAALTVLEVGFGTGLNFLLSAEYCNSQGVRMEYLGIEANPLAVETLAGLEYGQFVPEELWKEFLKKYPRSINEWILVGPNVSLCVFHQAILDFQAPVKVDIVYFDAFSATHQPEMWSDEVLAHLAGMINPGGIFVTYAITGDLKRSLRRLGFMIEKLPGAPGKREMLRALKI